MKLIMEQISGSNIIGGLPSCHCFTRPEFHKTSSLMPSKGKLPVTHEVVVGFDDEAKTVVDRLIRGSEQLEVVPIVGMPGLGETTFAKKVFNNPSVLHHFDIHFWCSVSQVYNKKNVLL
ncbi:hypothetical protein ACH5RR_028426 [Cinchona calisaya]|uniref:NB-ARC domain-containing protein n=1 Tax=Cinchona calisaya TaxID=153742 RepID=A0ABD2YSE1_9GENT